MCEGFSLDDSLALDAAHIAEYGFMVVGVGNAEGDERHAPWRTPWVCSTRPITPS
jgi:predicted dienelactone hydrolase